MRLLMHQPKRSHSTTWIIGNSDTVMIGSKHMMSGNEETICGGKHMEIGDNMRQSMIQRGDKR